MRHARRPGFAGRITSPAFAAVFGAAAVAAALLGMTGCATLQQTMGTVFPADSTGSGTLDEPTVIAGIKEALRVGTENTVVSTSKLDGFLGNRLIRIALPEQMTTVASTMRTGSSMRSDAGPRATMASTTSMPSTTRPKMA